MICLDVVIANREVKALVEILNRLATDPQWQLAFERDPQSFVAALDIPTDQKAALSNRQAEQIEAFFDRNSDHENSNP